MVFLDDGSFNHCCKNILKKPPDDESGGKASAKKATVKFIEDFSMVNLILCFLCNL